VQLINPAPRAHITSALLHPEAYAAQEPHPGVAKGGASGSDDAEGEVPVAWELPDTSILFRGYLEAGRMINVFDWYQSFAAVLQAQRQKGPGIADQKRAGDSLSDGTARDGMESDGDEAEREDGVEVEDEKWGMEVQARFIRGVHELDMMGFLKHTGRKPDHVARTVFDVSE
jgi:origin recognition complex subunit 3